MSFRFEPVVILDTVKYLIAALTALGVLNVEETTSQWVVGVVGAALTLVATVVTRSRVTPTARTTEPRHDYR